MTTIGFRAPGAVVPPVPPRAVPPRVQERVGVRRPAAAPPPATWARLGRVELHSARRYLTVWSAVLFVVLVGVMVLTYALLGLLGVLGSVSRALALVSNHDPSSGLVPALQPLHVLPMIVVTSLLLSGLFLVASFGLLLVHNATTSLTGGLRVRVRPDRRP